MSPRPSPKLAVVVSHPIQYYAPWFRHLALEGGIDLRVFYLSSAGFTASRDAGFGRTIAWDVPLLDGYSSEFVPSTARGTGTDRFFDLRNPTLARRVAAWQPDAVLVFGYAYAATLRLLATWARHSRAPLLFRGDSHLLGRAAGGLRRRLRRAVVAWALSRCSAFLATGRANRDFFLAHGAPPERIFHVPHCVDNARFGAEPALTRTAALEWRRSLGIPDDRFLVLFAGKLEPKKRPDLLLAAFQAARLPDATLLFVGHGSLEPSLRAAARAQVDVVFAPFQNQSAMPRTYAAADIMVLPSEGHQETWGLAVNEAMATGVPSIVSDVVGCGPDLISEGETGWSFLAGDRRALCDALQKTHAHLRDPGRRVRLRADLAARIGRYDYAAATAGLREAMACVTTQTPRP